MATLHSKPQPAAVPARVAPHRRAERPPELLRFDLLALAAEASGDKSYDESARVRVTQQDIRRLLERRRKEAR